jgi:hypothetical protein
MNDTRSSDQLRDEHRSVLGDRLGSIYHELQNQFFWLQLKWQEYVELFGTNPARIDLLNEAAPSFFHHLQDALWDDLLIHLCRITDRPEVNRKPNLTFTALPPLVDDAELRADITQLVADALEAAKFARDWRNRRLAHHDLRLALGAAAEPLAPASRLAVRGALTALHAILRRIDSHYFKSDLQQEVVGSLTGAERLLYVLYDGVRVDNKRRERMLSGEWLGEDLQPPPNL